MKILKKHRRAAAWAVALAAAAFAAYYFFLREGELPVEYRTAEVERRDMLLTIDATGTVEPEDLVNVGARVSGEIVSFGKDNKGFHGFCSVPKEVSVSPIVPQKAQSASVNRRQTRGLSRFFGIMNPGFLKDGSCSLFSRLDTRESSAHTFSPESSVK